MTTTSYVRAPLRPFDIEQNPNATHVLKSIAERFGRMYVGASSQPPRCSQDGFLDDATEDVHLACANGKTCRGTAFLPRGMFRVGLFMCEKRWSARDPDDDDAREARNMRNKMDTLQTDCFDRCICLACAVHSLVRTSFFCINCHHCLFKLRDNGNRHPPAVITSPLTSYQDYVLLRVTSHKYNKACVSFICYMIKQDPSLVAQVLHCSYMVHMLDYLQACGIQDLCNHQHVPPSVKHLASEFLSKVPHNTTMEFIARSRYLLPEEIHDMFALVASRLMGSKWEFAARERMKKFYLGSVTHRRPLRVILQGCSQQHDEEQLLASYNTSSIQATLPLDWTTNPNSLASGSGKQQL